LARLAQEARIQWVRRPVRRPDQSDAFAGDLAGCEFLFRVFNRAGGYRYRGTVDGCDFATPGFGVGAWREAERDAVQALRNAVEQLLEDRAEGAS